jgi:hypothetical protein
MLRGSVTALATNWNRFVSSHLPRGWFYFFGFIFLGRKIPAQQQRTCSYHSLEKFLTLSLGLGSLVKEAISTELLLAGSFEDRKHIQGNSGDPFQDAIQGIGEIDIVFILMYIKAFSDHYPGHCI